MTQIPLAKLRAHIVPLTGLILLTLAVYVQTLGYDFLSNWDDNRYVTSNHDIQGFTIANLFRIFTSSYVANYAPVHLLSYMFDFQLAGLNPSWFHGVNSLFHLINGLLFYFLVYRLTGKSFWAFVSSALFLLHPVQVESVAWISQRKNVLSMFFSLCSLISYTSYRRQNEGKKRHYFFSVIFLLLALLTKSIAVIIPAVFLLHDLFLESPRRSKGVLMDKIPHVILVALASGMALYTQAAAGATKDLFSGDSLAKILTMLTVFPKYLALLVCPIDLSVMYAIDTRYSLDGMVLYALLLAIAFCLLGSYLAVKDSIQFFGFAIFFLGLIPVSQVVPLLTLMNDRYLYFPMLGITWVVGGYASRLHERFPRQWISPAGLLVSVILVPCLWVSYQQAQVWENSIVLWGTTAKKLPENKDVRAALAEAYLKADQPDKALATYEDLFTLKTGFSYRLGEEKALNEAANLYIKSGQLGKALPLLVELTTKFPDVVSGQMKLGYYHYVNKDLVNAEKSYRIAVSLQPTSIQALVSLGIICQETGRLEEARRLFYKALENGGNGPDLQYNLACVEALAKKPEISLRHLETAFSLGYRDINSIINNPQFAAVRQLTSFDRLIGTYTKK